MILVTSACHLISFLGIWTIMKWFIVFRRKFTDNRRRKSHITQQGLGFYLKTKALGFKAKAKNVGLKAEAKAKA